VRSDSSLASTHPLSTNETPNHQTEKEGVVLEVYVIEDKKARMIEHCQRCKVRRALRKTGVSAEASLAYRRQPRSRHNSLIRTLVRIYATVGHVSTGWDDSRSKGSKIYDGSSRAGSAST
jgi:hypothetical protein